MTHPHDDEIDTLLVAIAETADVQPQAFLWLIDSRRKWRDRALQAENDVVLLEDLIQARQDTVG